GGNAVADGRGGRVQAGRWHARGRHHLPGRPLFPGRSLPRLAEGVLVPAAAARATDDRSPARLFPPGDGPQGGPRSKPRPPGSGGGTRRGFARAAFQYFHAGERAMNEVQTAVAEAQLAGGENTFRLRDGTEL